MYGMRKRGAFRDLRTFCLFIGYPRSGHSLVGSIINAHRHAVVSHELDVMRYVKWRFRRGQILALILARDSAFGENQRTWTGYSYVVPDQFQGSFEKLLVIGDKKGGRTTSRLRENPKLLDRFRRTIKLPIRLVHVVRNPYDNVATMALRSEQSLDRSIERYAESLDTNAEIMSLLGPESVLTLRHESFIMDPEGTLRDVCSFLQLDAPDEYLASCATIVFDTPRETRHEISWTADQRSAIERCVEKHLFLADYRF